MPNKEGQYRPNGYKQRARNIKLANTVERLLNHVPIETKVELTQQNLYTPKKLEFYLKHCTPQDPCYWCAVKPLR